MISHSPSRAFLELCSLFLLSSLALGQTHHSSSIGLPVPGRKFPWPPVQPADVRQISAAPLPALWRQAPRLFSAAMHEDTTTFTAVATPFPGLVAGGASWFDYDNDGDLDVVVTGYSDSGNVFRIYRNDGGGVFTDIHADIPQIGAVPNSISWGDYDKDGNFDLAIAGRLDTQSLVNVTKIYRNVNGKFVDIGAPLMGLYGGAVTWVDFDNDGDLDLLVTGSPDAGSTFYAILYRNDDSTFTDVQAGLRGSWSTTASWGDYDNDGDLDLLMTGYGGGPFTTIYRNDNGKFVDIGANLQAVNSAAAQWVDIDNDGDLDIVLTGAGPGDVPITKIYRNDGNDVFTDISAPIEQFMVSAIAIADYDNDGLPDIAISGADEFYSGSNPRTKIYHNENGTFVDIGANLVGTWFGSLAWGDYDNDGKLDLLVTGATIPRATWNGPFAQTTILYRNNSLTSNTRPTAPPPSAPSVSGHTVRLNWGHASDGQTPAAQLTYNLRVGTAPGLNDVIAPTSNIGTGYRRIPADGNALRKTDRTLQNLPLGTYYWSVQAVDGAYSGSTFSTEASFTVQPPKFWHLVSLAASYSDRSLATLFPSLGSPAFGFDGSAYQAKQELDYGSGYWMRSPGAASPTISSTGGPLAQVSVPVAPGWNLVGSVDHSVPAPAGGIITSHFFGYHGGYSIASTIDPGEGYWVKVSDAGSILLGGSEQVPKAAVPSPENSVTLTVKDASGNEQQLFLLDRVLTAPDQSLFEFPPTAPEQSFDVRFRSQRIAESITSGETHVIEVNSALYPISISATDPAGSRARLTLSSPEGSISNKPISGGDGIRITEGAVRQLVIHVDAAPAIPTEFTLEQNYPNPFNPSTTIAFDLPVRSVVTLRVYNVLGQAVATLVDNALMPGGRQRVRFNAGPLASGVYFYRLIAQSESAGTRGLERTFSDVKKMVVLR